jgi:hypothetical protein
MISLSPLAIQVSHNGKIKTPVLILPLLFLGLSQDGDTKIRHEKTA